MESNFSSLVAKLVVNLSLEVKSNLGLVGSVGDGTGSAEVKEAIASFVANFDDVFVTTFFAVVVAIVVAATLALLFLFLAI